MAYIFITKEKTNWKFLLIVIILGVIVGAGTLWFSAKLEFPLVEFPEIKRSEKIEDETAKWKTYLSPDGSLRAQIIPAKKNLIGNAYENRVEIWAKEGNLLQSADYISEDGDHGRIVARAEWTPNSEFFIYSTYSSGGHQPWFSKVYFYNRADNQIYDFSEVSGFIVADNEFVLAAPDIVTFTVYTCRGMGSTAIKSFKLSDVISNPPANLSECE